MNEDDLDKLVPMVCNMKDIDHNPYKISEDMVYKAFKKLEEYSKIKNKGRLWDEKKDTSQTDRLFVMR